MPQETIIPASMIYTFIERLEKDESLNEKEKSRIMITIVKIQSKLSFLSTIALKKSEELEEMDDFDKMDYEDEEIPVELGDNVSAPNGFFWLNRQGDGALLLHVCIWKGDLEIPHLGLNDPFLGWILSSNINSPIDGENANRIRNTLGKYNNRLGEIGKNVDEARHMVLDNMDHLEFHVNDGIPSLSIVDSFFKPVKKGKVLINSLLQAEMEDMRTTFIQENLEFIKNAIKKLGTILNDEETRKVMEIINAVNETSNKYPYKEKIKSVLKLREIMEMNDDILTKIIAGLPSGDETTG